MLLSDFLINSADKFHSKTALINMNRRISYKLLNELSSRFANALIDRGINRQDRVAVYLDNSIESVVSIFGILKAGAVFLVINPQVKSKKLSYILNDCQVKALVLDNTAIQQFIDGSVESLDLKNLIITDYGIRDDKFEPDYVPDVSSNYKNFVFESFSEILKNSEIYEPPRRSIDIDLASLTYTSGSTGDPKGVMLTHLNMVTAASSIVQYLQNRPDDIILNYLPLSFDYGLYQVLMSSKFGGTVVLEKAFVYPFQAVNRILKEKVTGFPIVPAMAALLLQLKDIDKTDFSHMRYLSNTGQALAPAHITGLQSVFKKAEIYSMYGLTECKRVSFLPPSELKKRPLSVGKAIPNTEVWLVDEHGNRITEPWKTGELVIRGAHVMKGYWNKPEETAAVLKPGKYPDEKILMSRDIFKMDEEGFLYFVSRKDDVIKSGGERISPKEIEDVLYEMDGVLEAAVIGVPDQILGNAIKAFVVLKKDCSKSIDEILDFCSKRLEHSRIPKFLEFRDSLPKSSSGKIKKTDLI